MTAKIFITCWDGCLGRASHDLASGRHSEADTCLGDCNVAPALPLGANYTSFGDVFGAELGACPCTSVWYSTLAACAVCQGRGLAIDPWVLDAFAIMECLF